MIATLLMAAQLSAGFGTQPQKEFPPAHCEKYQHVVHHPGYASGPECTPPPGREHDMSIGCPAIIFWHQEEADTCADDMHEITERDWQQLMKRIERLEEYSPDGRMVAK